CSERRQLAPVLRARPHQQPRNRCCRDPMAGSQEWHIPCCPGRVTECAPCPLGEPGAREDEVVQNAGIKAGARLRQFGPAAAAVGLVWASAAAAFAQDAAAAAPPPTINAGDTAWVLVSSAIVLMMTIPALALFYGGLVRSKSVLSILMQCLVSAGL